MTDLPVLNDLEELAAAVRSCERCRLHHTRTRSVPGEGDPRAAIVFIGEGPGYQEDQQGRPFVGPAGQLLDGLIEGIGFRRADVFIGNVVKCRPPENRDPAEDEAQACRPYLTRQIELIDPKLIVLLGRHALNAFFPDARISKAHGTLRTIDARRFLPVYHPAAALRQGRLRTILEQDFTLIPKLLSEPTSTVEQAAPESPARQLSLFS